MSATCFAQPTVPDIISPCHSVCSVANRARIDFSASLTQLDSSWCSLLRVLGTFCITTSIILGIFCANVEASIYSKTRKSIRLNSPVAGIFFGLLTSSVQHPIRDQICSVNLKNFRKIWGKKIPVCQHLFTLSTATMNGFSLNSVPVDSGTSLPIGLLQMVSTAPPISWYRI